MILFLDKNIRKKILKFSIHYLLPILLLFDSNILFYSYYGTNSVCIPRLFVTRSESSWQFSMAVTIFNFLAFVFVAIAYWELISCSKHEHR